MFLQSVFRLCLKVNTSDSFNELVNELSEDAHINVPDYHRDSASLSSRSGIGAV